MEKDHNSTRVKSNNTSFIRSVSQSLTHITLNHTVCWSKMNTCLSTSISKISIKWMSMFQSLFLYFGLLSDIVCHPGLEVHIGMVIPDALQFCTWNKNHFCFVIPNLEMFTIMFIKSWFHNILHKITIMMPSCFWEDFCIN
jgi:hypothetical protein